MPLTQPKTDLAYLRSEKAKAEQQLRYYQHREKILEHQIPELTRKARVHRLCTRAGMLESFLIAPEELTNDQVMELLKIAFRQPEGSSARTSSGLEINHTPAALSAIDEAEQILTEHSIPLPQDQQALNFIMKHRDGHYGKPFDGIPLSSIL